MAQSNFSSSRRIDLGQKISIFEPAGIGCLIVIVNWYVVTYPAILLYWEMLEYNISAGVETFIESSLKFYPALVATSSLLESKMLKRNSELAFVEFGQAILLTKTSIGIPAVA